jgi:hypothetical protein
MVKYPIALSAQLLELNTSQKLIIYDNVFNDNDDHKNSIKMSIVFNILMKFYYIYISLYDISL